MDHNLSGTSPVAKPQNHSNDMALLLLRKSQETTMRVIEENKRLRAQQQVDGSRKKRRTRTVCSVDARLSHEQEQKHLQEVFKNNSIEAYCPMCDEKIITVCNYCIVCFFLYLLLAK